MKKKTSSIKIVLIALGLLVSLAIVAVFIFSSQVGGRFAFGKKTKHVGGDGGSMYPTLSWCDYEGGPDKCSEIANTQNRRVVPELILKDKDFKPERGMIVDVKHDGVEYGKRIVGLPGDILLINDGYIYVNGQKLDEPYLWKPGMTYSWDFLQQCQETKVPAGKIVILGDNRPLSHDSRDFGFADIDEVVAYLPLDAQNDIKQLWGTFPMPHPMTKQEAEVFLSEVNKLRVGNGLSSITLDSKMNQAAEMIAESRVKGLDFSPQPSKDTTVRITDALTKAGYRGSEQKFGTLTIFGAYDLEIYKYQLTINESLRNSLLKPELAKIGVGIYQGKTTSSNCSAGLTSIVMGLK